MNGVVCLILVVLVAVFSLSRKRSKLYGMVFTSYCRFACFAVFFSFSSHTLLSVKP